MHNVGAALGNIDLLTRMNEYRLARLEIASMLHWAS